MTGRLRILGLVLAALATIPACEDQDIEAFEEALRMTDFPAQAALAGNPTQGEFKEAIAAFLDATRQLPGARANTAALTIASGAITPTKGFHTVNTEGDAAADDLSTIDQTNLPDGSFLYLLQALDARTVTIKHGAGGDGEILLPGNVDITLTNAFDGVILRRRTNQWVFVSRLSNLPSTVTPHGYAAFWEPGVYSWTVPGGVETIFVTMIGGGGGGGGGGDSTGPSNGSDGADGTASSFYGDSGLGSAISATFGALGGGGRGDGSMPAAYSSAELPRGTAGGRAAYTTMGSGLNGKGGTGGEGIGTASGGAAGQSGGVKIAVPYSVQSVNETIYVFVGSGGAGGAGAGSGGNGGNGFPGAVLIQY